LLCHKNIVYFGPEKWEGMWRNRHQLMYRFSKNNKVIYVEPKISFNILRAKIFRDGFYFKEFVKKVFQRRIEKVSHNLYIYHSPFFIPIIGKNPFDKITWWAWKLLLKFKLKRLGFSKSILWFSRPYMHNLLNGIKSEFKIYHIVDEYSSYGKITSKKKNKIKYMERELLKKVDMVIVVSKELFDSKSKFNDNTYLIPNGVDFGTYNSVYNGVTEKPLDVAMLESPIIGYSGLISSRLNLDLIEDVAEERPDWSIALVGSVSEKCKAILNELCKKRNIWYLGLKSHDKVPHYIKAFDVCIIPYRITEETQNLSSLKLYEYMAMGKPIVTSDFKSIDKLKKYVRVAKQKNDFIKYIEDSLNEKNSDKVSERRSFAADNTWENRIMRISEKINCHLGIKNN
jgi:glycosyltransferase involved in cell wall biosynthesis